MHYFQKILKELDVKYTLYFTRQLFDNRSDSNTLYGIKKMLEVYGVDTTALEVTDKKIDALSYPFIASCHGTYIVVQSCPSDVAEFEANWDGLALSVNAGGLRREPHYCAHLFGSFLKSFLPFLLGLTILALIGSSLYTASLNCIAYKLFLYVLIAVGALFCRRILLKKCSGRCLGVLEPSTSLFLGRYSLGAVGLSYFVAAFVHLVAFPSFDFVFALMSCMAMVVPVWSISYQKFVVKAWCVNCLGVQTSLLLILVVQVFYGAVDLSQVKCLSLTVFVSLWLVAFFIIQKHYDMRRQIERSPRNLVQLYCNLLKNDSVRQLVIASGDEFDTSAASTILLHRAEAVSSSESPKELFVLLNPFCLSCHELFFKLKEQLESGMLKAYNVTISFSPEESAQPVCGLAIAKYQKDGTEAVLDLLSNWYRHPKLRDFRRQYAACDKTEQLTAELNRQKIWYENHHVNSVPLLLIDNHLIDPLLLEYIV